MQRVSSRAAAVIALAASILALALHAQNSAGSGLVIQVNPESYLDTPVAGLSFQVNNPGETVYSRPVTITAWVRALAGQQIHVTLQPQMLNGPAGTAPSARLSWTAVMASATGGATAATCISSNFSAGPLQQLIGNWTRSGIAKCTVTFALTTDSTWTAGSYTGTVALNLSAQ